MSEQDTRSAALAAAVEFAAAKLRFNPYMPGDVIVTGEEVMKLADRFWRYIWLGQVVGDREAWLSASTSVPLVSDDE